MNGYSGLRSVTDGSNIDPNKKTTKIIVDPHELDSFTIDIRLSTVLTVQL